MKKTNSIRLTAVILALCMLVMAGCSKPSTSESSSSSGSSSGSNSGENVKGEIRDRIFLGEKIEKGVQRNDDTVGWITIPNTTIDDAVLQRTDPDATHLENNSYYLRLNEDKKYNIFGCYWADPGSNMGSRADLSRNTIVYGHADYKDNKDGPKFSQLFHYDDIEFLKNNPYIYYSTEDEDMVWQVFSVFYTHINFVYILPNPSESEFKKIVDEAKAKSEYIIDMPITKDDKILTLSTCSGLYKAGDKDNYRYVVMAKLLPTGEVPEGAVKVAVNPNPQKS